MIVAPGQRHASAPFVSFYLIGVVAPAPDTHLGLRKLLQGDGRDPGSLLPIAVSALTERWLKKATLEKNGGIGMKMIDNKKAPAFSGKQMDELRKELRESFRDDHSWRLEALGRILETAEASPALFRQSWIQPLQAAGLSFEVAVARVVDSYFQPN